jgi:hypothetical protein
MGAMRRRSMVLAVVVALALIGACGSAAPSGPASALPASALPASAAASPAASVAPSASSAPATTGPPAEIPDTPVGRRLRWVLDQVNGGAATLASADAAAATTPDFAAQVSGAQLVDVFRQIGASAPYLVSSFDGSGDGLSASARIEGKGSALIVRVAVTQDPDHRIAGLLFSPAPPETGYASWSEFDPALAALASSTNAVAAEIVDGTCRTVHGKDASSVLAIGSTFKLWILAELASQVHDGKAAWSEQLAVHDAWKSVPSGTTQDEAAGTLHTLEEWGRLMISISDNTAADHLARRLGRERVEAQLTSILGSVPPGDVPFIYTREMAQLKSPTYATVRTAFIAAPVAERRALLDQVDAQPLPSAFDPWITPRDIETIEWFASAGGLCASMARLDTLRRRAGLEPVGSLLAVNPGMSVDPGTWTYVGYKGGSEPGVLNLTWLLDRADGRTFVLSVGLNDPQRGDLDTMAALTVAARALPLLAAVP